MKIHRLSRRQLLGTTLTLGLASQVPRILGAQRTRLSILVFHRTWNWPEMASVLRDFALNFKARTGIEIAFTVNKDSIWSAAQNLDRQQVDGILQMPLPDRFPALSVFSGLPASLDASTSTAWLMTGEIIFLELKQNLCSSAVSIQIMAN